MSSFARSQSSLAGCRVRHWQKRSRFSAVGYCSPGLPRAPCGNAASVITRPLADKVLTAGLTRHKRILVLETNSMTSDCAPSTFAAMDRIDGRADDELRPVAFDLGIAPYAGGSVLVTM